MDKAPHDITAQQAAEMLDWLIAMGADEVIAEDAVNRLDTVVVAKPVDVPRPAVAPVVVQPVVAVLGDDEISLAAVAAQCGSLEALQAAVSAFRGNALAKGAGLSGFIGGNLQSKIMIIGDRPRSDEDREGQPFAGKAFVLLQNMLKAIGLSPDLVMLANVVPWRPPGNRPPTDIEIKQCAPLIARAVELAAPKIVLGLGGLAGQCLASTKSAVISQRAQWAAIQGVPFTATFHPDELLKSPTRKKLAWHDLQMFKAKLDTL